MMRRTIMERWPNSSRTDVPLQSLGEADCILAIERATALIVTCTPDEMHKHYGPDGQLWVRFAMGDRCMLEDEFYEHVCNNCPGAVPALRKLIERFTAHWDFDFPSGGSFAAAALAYLDQRSLPLVARHFRVIHAFNDDFNFEVVEKLIEKHGWSLATIDFVIAWFEQTEHNCHREWWIKRRLLEAARALMGPKEFVNHYFAVLADYEPFRAKRNCLGTDGLELLWGECFEAGFEKRFVHGKRWLCWVMM
jgi:hypothetical protein